jgi:predicted Zn-dependent protease
MAMIELSRRSLAVGALFAALTAAGCGGLGLADLGGGIGGGGIGAGCTAQTYTPNYVHVLSRDELMHWRRFPVRVFFEVDQHWTIQRQQNAIAGFNRWLEGAVLTDGQPAVEYQIVDSRAQAQVTVRFVPQAQLGGNTVGTTNVTYRSDYSLIRADIRLSTTGISGGPYSASAQRSTAAHEFGHALGIMGHSPFQTDVMYFASSREQVTANDVNTLFTAYCGQFLRSRAQTVADDDVPAGTVSISCGPGHQHP